MAFNIKRLSALRAANKGNDNRRAKALYQKNKNLLGNSLDKWLLNDLKDKSEKNTLAIYEENIEQAQQELDKKKGIYQNNEKGFLEARKRLRLARQDLNEATLKLQNAQQEYSSEKSRIARKRR